MVINHSLIMITILASFCYSNYYFYYCTIENMANTKTVNTIQMLFTECDGISQVPKVAQQRSNIIRMMTEHNSFEHT